MQKIKKILIIDDENIYYEMIKDIDPSKYIFYHEFNCSKVVDSVFSNEIDLILLDWNLGKDEGVDFIQSIKKSTKNKIPIVMLSGKSNEKDMIFALDKGADDYITKPFNVDFLISKINTKLRTEKKEIWNEDELTIMIYGKKIFLTKKEFLIFKLLYNNPEKSFNRKDINYYCEGQNVFVSLRTIDTIISYIRKKIGNNKIIFTIPKIGYKINLDEINKLKTINVVEDMILIEEENVIKYKDVPLDLTKKEFSILSLLLKNYNKPVTRDKILEKINKGTITTPRVVDTHILNIRKKLPEGYEIIFSNRIGYCIKKNAV